MSFEGLRFLEDIKSFEWGGSSSDHLPIASWKAVNYADKIFDGTRMIDAKEAGIDESKLPNGGPFTIYTRIKVFGS